MKAIDIVHRLGQRRPASLQRLLEKYNPSDIYNVDETGLFHQCLEAVKVVDYDIVNVEKQRVYDTGVPTY